jgi:hypothetical protein
VFPITPVMRTKFESRMGDQPSPKGGLAKHPKQVATTKWTQEEKRHDFQIKIIQMQRCVGSWMGQSQRLVDRFVPHEYNPQS